MAAVVPDTPIGISLTFAASGMLNGFSAEVVSFNHNIENNVIQKSHFGSTAPAAGQFGGHEHMTGDLQTVTYSMEIHFDSDQSPPMVGVATSLTWDWPNGADYAGDFVVGSFNITGQVEDKMMATIELTADGVVAHTASV